jgi:hypothetical protein
MTDAVAMSGESSKEFSLGRTDTSEVDRSQRMFITVPREELDVNARRNTLGRVSRSCGDEFSD